MGTSVVGGVGGPIGAGSATEAREEEKEEDRGALLLWVTALLGIGVFNAVVSIMRHRTMSLVRMDASLRTIRAVLLGSALHRRVSTGELSTMQAADVGRIAQILTMTGPGVGAVVAYAGVAVLLFTISTPLALVVVLGIPLLSLTIGPLLQTLHARQSTYREQEGAPTTPTPAARTC